MGQPILSIPFRIHTKPPVFEQIKNCFDPIARYVIKIFKQIGDFFYNLFYPDSKNKPVLIVNPHQMHTTDPKNIIAFYRDNEPNVDGLTFRNLLNADDRFLEQNHAWVQWVFPLEKPSAFNGTAPALNQALIAEMKIDTVIRENVLKAFGRVILFFGLKYDGNNGILRGENFAKATKNWLTPGNHNFLRITRIIHSLGLIMGPPNEYGKMLFDIMEDIYLHEGKGIIPERTYQIWKKAI